MNTSEAIIYQSLVDSSKQPMQQISNLVLSGFITIDAYLNTDKGKLYASYSHEDSEYVLRLYKDAAKTQLVASASSSAFGQVEVVQENDSGISGSVYFQQYVGDDTNMIVVCFLTTDGDLRMTSLETLCTYDGQYGFAAYHLQGFDEARRAVISRQKANIWNSEFLDSRNLQGVTGGYDLSRCLNFYEALREGVGYYVLALILESQYIAPDSIFDVRSKESKAAAKACFEGADLTFSWSQTRVEERDRTNRTRKIERA